jgi:hypothetical protein
VPWSRSSRRVAARADSSAADHSWSVLVSPQTWLVVRPSSRNAVRNGRPLEIASRSCCRISTGSRFCARARPRVLWSSLCTRRHRAQLQPLSHRASVPCAAASLTWVRVATSPATPPHGSGPPWVLCHSVTARMPEINANASAADVGDISPQNGAGTPSWIRRSSCQALRGRRQPKFVSSSALLSPGERSPEAE